MEREESMGRPQPKFRSLVKMKKPWIDEWIKKPSIRDVLEAFADGILRGNVDELFEIKIEKIK